MRVGIFPAMAGRRAAGVEVYEIELVRALAAGDSGDDYHVFCFDAVAAEAFGVARPRWTFHVLRPSWRPVAHLASLPAAVRATGCDVLHSTYIPPAWTHTPQVFSLHDTSVFDRPDFYHVRHRKLLQILQARGVRTAARVICPSYATHARAAARFPGRADRMTVVFDGLGQEMRGLPADVARAFVRERFGVAVPFAVSVGQLRTRHKNLPMLLEAFRRCAAAMAPAPVQLVLVGKPSWTTGDLSQEIERLGLRDRVVLTGHVTSEELAALYCAATMLAFPSRSEGFGFPVVEAMHLGVPVVAARATSLPEILGDAGVLVDPDSPAEMATAMLGLFTDMSRCRALAERGHAHVQQFSWERTAAETQAIYRAVAGPRGKGR